MQIDFPDPNVESVHLDCSQLLEWLFSRQKLQDLMLSIDISTGNYTSVIRIDDGAVIANCCVRDIEISEIRTPDLIWLFYKEILLKEIWKHLVGM